MMLICSMCTETYRKYVEHKLQFSGLYHLNIKKIRTEVKTLDGGPVRKNASLMQTFIVL